MNNSLLRQLREALLISPSFAPSGGGGKTYDPEMLYVECNLCGKPVMWEEGRTTSLLARSGISPHMVDEHCLILSDGCRDCSPGASDYQLSIVRLAGISAEELLLIQKHGGTA